MAKKKHNLFMKTAMLVANESKCVSHHVGAVIVKDNRIISVGYNGTTPGLKNCNDVFNENNFDKDQHRQWSLDNEIHAEMNAILFAAKEGNKINGADMYVTLHPCNNCLKNISMSGIKNVYYLNNHHKDKINTELLKVVNVQQIKTLDLNNFEDKNNLLK